jgi:hypothetical protein
MADGSSRLDASGVSETIASDDIGGQKYQRVKLNVGADNTAVDVAPQGDGGDDGRDGSGARLHVQPRRFDVEPV